MWGGAFFKKVDLFACFLRESGLFCVFFFLKSGLFCVLLGRNWTIFGKTCPKLWTILDTLGHEGGGVLSHPSHPTLATGLTTSAKVGW